MKISYRWLQNYFTEKLPQPEKLAEIITMRSSEVEGVETIGDDTVLDIKVLPDRAHYALSHKGIAYEVSAMTGLKIKDIKFTVPNFKGQGTVLVKNDASKLCSRYMACLIENIEVTDSSEKIKNYLEAIGARSINSIVDATNFTMFDIGQPLHAFDADKVVGNITIRLAKNGEKITLLDGREVELDQTVLVIADDSGALAIAGVKGGKRAEVTKETKRIIVESANFDPTTVRRTSTRLDLRNDSSKRFENEITAHLAKDGMNHFLSQILEINPQVNIFNINDVHQDLPKQRIIICNKKDIDKVLGLIIPQKEFESLLERLAIFYSVKGDEYTLIIPHERLDIIISEDVAEEVGRLYGYENISSLPLDKFNFQAKVEPIYYVSEKIKNILYERGFSEVITQTLGKKGDLEVSYPVAKDRGFLRTSLLTRMTEVLDNNMHHLGLLGLNELRVFEIGKVFIKDLEKLQLVIANRSSVKKKKNTVDVKDEVIKIISEGFGVSLDIIEKTEDVICIDLDSLISKIKVPDNYGDAIKLEPKKVEYKKISTYPYVARDIAVFVPVDVKVEELEKIIDDNASNLLVRRDLFDVFKNSYAFRLIFQSMERTLTDLEVNTIMEKITSEMNQKSGWQVR